MSTFSDAWEMMHRKDFEAAYDGFLSAFAEAADGSPGKSRAFDAAAFMRMKLPEPKCGLEALLRRDDVVASGVACRTVYEASLALLAGDLERFWALSGELPNFDHRAFGPWNRGLNSALTQRQHAIHTRISRQLAKIGVPSCRAVSNEPTLLFGADSSYFKRFARNCVESYRRIGGSETMVFHLINGDREAHDLAAKLRRDHCDVHVNNITLVGATRPVFASLRYWVAADHMRQTGRPVFVFDIDVGFRRTVTEFIGSSDFNRDRIGLRISPVACLPWQKITVNALYLPHNTVGLAFAEHMSIFLKDAFSRAGDRDMWWVDQNAALSAYLGAEDKACQNIRVKDFLALPVLWEDREKAVKV